MVYVWPAFDEGLKHNVTLPDVLALKKLMAVLFSVSVIHPVAPPYVVVAEKALPRSHLAYTESALVMVDISPA